MRIIFKNITLSLILIAFPLFFLSGLLKSAALFYASIAFFGLGASFLAVDLFKLAFGVVDRSEE